MTPAEGLRAAAAKIRERMKDANNAAWCGEYAHWAIRHVERNCDLDTLDHAEWHDKGEVCEGFGMYAGRYMALWHPGVGELVADWLEAMAQENENLARLAQAAMPEVEVSLPGPFGSWRAMAIARAINGGA